MFSSGSLEAGTVGEKEKSRRRWSQQATRGTPAVGQAFVVSEADQEAC